MILLKRLFNLNQSKTRISILVFALISSFSNLTNAYFYQINSEALNSPKTNTVQGDLKLLLGVESQVPAPTREFFNRSRAAVGLYSFYQSADDPTYYLRNGLVAQLRTNLYLNNVFLQYEHHEFQFKTSISESRNITSYIWNSENRIGLIFSKFFSISSFLDSDTYFESFFIPEVSKTDLLSVLRSSLIYKISENSSVNPLAEVYLKQSPFLFGGDIRELRIGAQWRPCAAVSLKLMANVLPPSLVSNTGLLFQLNIFQEGQL